MNSLVAKFLTNWRSPPSLSFRRRGPAPKTRRPPTAATENNGSLLTIFLTHDRRRPPEELNTQLRQQGFSRRSLPPASKW